MITNVIFFSCFAIPINGEDILISLYNYIFISVLIDVPIVRTKKDLVSQNEGIESLFLF
jgi:hypothetical protein